MILKLSIKLIAFSAALFYFAAAPKASEIEFVLDAVSHHVNAKSQFHEEHNAIGIGFKNVELMTFINSYGVRSYAGDINFQHPLIDDHLWVGVKVGAAYGYGGIGRYPDLLPFVAPYVKGYTGPVGLSLMAIPAVGDQADAVIVFMARFRIKME
ncbi:hypothetical protein CS022_15165 [Veronia nyctiphanis]|uniref:Uncharacterized protein n=1 Tax=Veronia nyctiphanis TaxID=1278244 RepID=A0A4Q0YR20_9GAMM|nr:hypothetical protein [Veronia nyctiphanis]RXJ72524.1 hypothetical protein CS022_15165 [Veronia nyctiphanis]